MDIEFGLQHATKQDVRQPRILCHINHYFGSTSKFIGRSTSGARATRERVVRIVLSQIRTLPYKIDLRICGFPQDALIPIDIDLSAIGDPRWIVYESIERMFASVDDYDCFLNIEDDILISENIIANALVFNTVSEVNEVYLPNRMEQRANGAMACVDLEAVPGWAELNRIFRDIVLDVAVNPHSGLFFLTQPQMRYAADRISLQRREQFHGGYMASAYANVHAPFLVWRAKSDLMAHHVVHADKWMHSADEVHASRRLLEERDQDPRAAALPGTGPLGYVDTIAIDGLFCRANGWAIDAAGQPLDLSAIHLGPYRVTDFAVMRYDRPDVMEVYPHAKAGVGFELRFPLLGLPEEGLAVDALEVHGQTLEQFDVELCVAPGATWPALKARQAAASAPIISDAPWLPAPAAERLREMLKSSNSYLEYGSGATTVMAASMGVRHVITTESDPNWLAALRHKLRLLGSPTQAELIHVDIGPTGEWGFPTSDANWRDYPKYPVTGWTHCLSHNLTPDVVLIDGRFRVACFLASLVFGTQGTRILFDDYFDRPYYHTVEQFLRPAARHDRAAEFVIVDAPAMGDICLELMSATSDPR
jgi:hypothetical protein